MKKGNAITLHKQQLIKNWYLKKTLYLSDKQKLIALKKWINYLLEKKEIVMAKTLLEEERQVRARIAAKKTLLDKIKDFFKKLIKGA